MSEHVKLVVGCVVFIPLVVLLLASAWKLWHGKWLRTVADGWTFAPGEKPDSPYYRRKAKRMALYNLVLAVMLAGWLCLLAVDELGGAPANGFDLLSPCFLICFAGGGIWVLAGSRRDGKAIAAAAAGTGPGLAEEYEFGARQIAVLAIVLLAVPALEIALFLLGR